MLLVVLCGLTFFAGLGRPAVMDSDEAFYAEAAREIWKEQIARTANDDVLHSTYRTATDPETGKVAK